MWLCAYLCLCLCTTTHLLCVCLLLLPCLCACGCAGMGHGHSAEFTETGLVSACRAVFRLCIYALDNHSNLYHRLVIHVCLLCSALIRFHQEAPLSLSLPPNRNVSRYPRSEFHQPPLIVADQAFSGFHSKDATLKLTTSIITRPYFSDEFV